jgi:hypothetical protein
MEAEMGSTFRFASGVKKWDENIFENFTMS